MNATRRKELAKIINRYYHIQDLIDSVKSDLESILEEEQEAFDNLPESLQESCKGEAMQEAIENLEEAVSWGDMAEIDCITQYIEDAMA